MKETKRPTSPQLIVQAAEQLGLVVHTWTDIAPGFARLQLGNHIEYVYFSDTDLLGRATHRMFWHKPLAIALLREAGFPVPQEILTSSVEEAAAFLRKHGRVVIKPTGNTGGRGVTPGIVREDELARAFAEARAHTSATLLNQAVVCQQHVEGNDFRVLVVNGVDLFAIQRIPAHVVGDGQHTVRELVEQRNAKVPRPYHIRLEKTATDLLREQGLNEDSVIKTGAHVRLARVANAHAGGTLRDVTPSLNQAVRELARKVAQHFSVPLVGIDIISPDISAEKKHIIIEVNATPDLTIHHFPDEGEARDVATVVVRMLFPELNT